MKMLNIGCGTTFHPDWINIDLVAHSPHVNASDITKGLPFDSETFEVCYSSHILEHLRKAEADLLLREQKRVLKPNGIIRVVVPDLEMICRNYLKYLDEMIAGDLTHEFRYDYSLLELYDQTTRDTSGGELGKLWASGTIADWDFIIARHGKVAADAIQAIQQAQTAIAKNIATKKQTRWSLAMQRIGNFTRQKKYALADGIVLLLLGAKGRNALREGWFRNSGEIHRVMYDQYSIKRLLESQGFSKVRICQAGESWIPDFSRYALDMVDGAIRKPDSLFVEAIRV